MELKNYLKTNNVSRKEFANQLGVKLTYLNNICQRPSQIGIKTAIRIVKLSKGKVTYSDLGLDTKLCDYIL